MRLDFFIALGFFHTLSGEMTQKIGLSHGKRQRLMDV